MVSKLSIESIGYMIVIYVLTERRSCVKVCHCVEQSQWLNYSKVDGGTLHFHPTFSLPSYPFPSLSLLSPPFFLPFLLLEVGPFNPATGSGGVL